MNKGKNILSKVFARRNIVIFSVVVLIGLAVYLNYLWFYDPIDAVGYGDQDTSGDVADDGTGDSLPTGGGTDYFSATILSRQTARDEAMEVLQSVVDTAEGEEREAALAGITKLANDMEQEASIESLVKAKGYAQCVTVISGDSASVVVSSEIPLEESQVAQITEIVYETAGILPVNLTIMQR